VASDRTLRELAEQKPASPAQLGMVYGIGPTKAKRYGEEWLTVIGRTR
jgi:superfamily II DNA helicase RecQ